MENNNTNILDKDDFVKFMLNNSDYDEMDILEFAEEHMQNLKSIDDNVIQFIIWYDEK